MSENVIDYIFYIVVGVIGWVVKKLDDSHKDLKSSDAAICKKVAEIELVAAREYPTRAELKGYFDKLADEVDNFLKKTGMNIRVKRSKPRSAGLGTAAGRVAGDNVNLRSALR